jgi:hypothetical protein
LALPGVLFSSGTCVELGHHSADAVAEGAFAGCSFGRSGNSTKNAAPGTDPKYLRVLVERPEDGKPSKVNVR